MSKAVLTRIFLFFILLGMVNFDGYAVKQRLRLPNNKEAINKRTHKPGKEISLVCESVSPSDTLRFKNLTSLLTFTGYDKKANSAYESFFITNGSQTDTICEIQLELEYLTTDGRSFHKRSATVKTELPPGQTRKADIKSWDTQKSFYYYKSQRPKSSATPFKVIFRITSLSLRPYSLSKPSM